MKEDCGIEIQDNNNNRIHSNQCIAFSNASTIRESIFEVDEINAASTKVTQNVQATEIVGKLTIRN